jgi:hypothetical protein
VRSQGTKRDVWSYKARIVTKPFKPLSNPSILALPSPEAAARLPEAITTAGESGD